MFLISKIIQIIKKNPTDPSFEWLCIQKLKVL